VKDANKVVSSHNSFKNCYQTSKGSIFFLTTSPTETTYITELEEQGGSTYEANQAQYGGVIYCDVCKIKMTGNSANPILFKNNSA
jgi:hypothetical protein